MIDTLQGWLLDLYAHPQDGLVWWVLGADGERYRLRQDFPVTFYVAGPHQQLRELWRWLRSQPEKVHLSREERHELFQEKLQTVLAVQVREPQALEGLFRRVAQAFPDLTYYDVDIPLATRHGSFPLSQMALRVEQGVVKDFSIQDSPWALEQALPSLRIMKLQPEVDPAHREPKYLGVQYGSARRYQLPFKPARPFLIGLGALLRRYDPDILLTLWGDSWLLPRLLAMSAEHHIPLPLNRETNIEVLARPARSYFAYGQVIYRGPKLLLFGRWHIDIANTVMYHDYGLAGVIEMARVTGLPVQTAARVSPGTGISAMQIRTALQWQVLVPWHKQQVERPKSARMLLHTDKGGMVYQPLIGLHQDVIEIDFTSMYPAIMVHFNISPETVGTYGTTCLPVPELGLEIEQARPGLVPETLRPLLEKRITLKTQLLEMDPRDCRYAMYKAWAAAYKWLLVVCFGYLGYKNARFGRIEAHEAVTAYGREALLRAKEAAEDLGYTVLHMYVDGLWVQKQGANTVAAAQPLLDEILERTGLPIALDGIYKWVAFLPSRSDPHVPVANRYFGVFQSGEIKLRGIEARRRDTPKFIKQLQLELIKQMEKADPADLAACLPQVVKLLQSKLADLRQGRIPLEELLVTQTLSRELDAYKVPSPVARATQQLAAEGQELRPGQPVRFLYTRGRPGVFAWDCQAQPKPESVDVARYITLLLRAAHTVLQPLGVDEETLRLWVLGNAGYGAKPGVLPLLEAFPATIVTTFP